MIHVLNTPLVWTTPVLPMACPVFVNLAMPPMQTENVKVGYQARGIVWIICSRIHTIVSNASDNLQHRTV